MSYFFFTGIDPVTRESGFADSITVSIHQPLKVSFTFSIQINTFHSLQAALPRGLKPG
jgi:hypothetical protein